MTINLVSDVQNRDVAGILRPLNYPVRKSLEARNIQQTTCLILTEDVTMGVCEQCGTHFVKLSVEICNKCTKILDPSLTEFQKQDIQVRRFSNTLNL